MVTEGLHSLQDQEECVCKELCEEKAHVTLEDVLMGYLLQSVFRVVLEDHRRTLAQTVHFDRV